MKLLKELIGSAILNETTGEPVAFLKDLIFNPDSGKLEGIWVKPITIPIANGIIRFEDILSWKNHIFIKNDSVIAGPGEIIKITNILDRGIYFYGNKVQNEASKYVGNVYDIEIDVKKGYLINIYTKKGFSIFSFDKRIFAYDSIIEAFPDYILVKEGAEVKDKVAKTTPEMA